MSNILLLSAGRRVSLLRGFQDAASRRSNVGVITADSAPNLSAACQCADVAYKLPRVGADGYADALRALCKRENVSLVVPTIDPELPVLASLQSSFKQENIHLLVSDTSLIDVFSDKRTTAEYFSERGLRTPALQSTDALKFPVFVKPYDGSLSAGAMLARSADELPNATLNNPRNIFCEYIDHKEFDEFTCDLYFTQNGKLACAVPRKRLEVRGGEVSKAQTCKNEIVPLLFDVFGQCDGAQGPVTLQLFRNPKSGEMIFIEFNARFGGGYPLTRHAGADFQSWLIDEYLEHNEPPVFHDWSDGTVMLRYDDEVIIPPA